MDGPLPARLTEEWHDFFNSEPTQNKLFKHPVLFPLQRQREMLRMLEIGNRLPVRVFYEIGIDKGGSLQQWCSLPTMEMMIASEIRGMPQQKEFEAAFPHIRFHWVSGSSYDPKNVQQVEKFLNGRKIDCLFIDGDKLEFLRDFDNHLTFMGQKSIVFMHDFRDEAPNRAYTAVKSRGFRCEEILDTSEYVEVSQRVSSGDTSTSPYEDWLLHWKGQSCGVAVIYLD